jgi:hypothetical protein
MSIQEIITIVKTDINLSNNIFLAIIIFISNNTNNINSINNINCINCINNIDNTINVKNNNIWYNVSYTVNNNNKNNNNNNIY